MTSPHSRWSWGRRGLYALHWLIILNFVVEILYASYMVFVVVAPPGGGPLASRALEIPFEMMTTRRLYATEFWIAMGGLAIYLALTEIGPRLRAYRQADADAAHSA
jgi:hypothetical protein